MSELIVFHVQDSTGRAVSGALVQGDGVTKGHWQGLTNPCGDFSAMLDADHYTLTVSASGLTTRTLPADLANSGIVTIGLEGAAFQMPTRDQLLNGLTTQQGLSITTSQFGVMPWWGGCWAWLSPADRQLAAQQLQAAGNTICLIQIPDGGPLYDEPNQFYTADKFGPLDLTKGNTDMTAVVALVQEAMKLGFQGVWLFLGGDDGPRGYPVAIQQTTLLGEALGGLHGCVVQLPGWDGVWYGYSPEQVASFADTARAAGALYVGVEHSTGHLPLGNGAADFNPGGLMNGYDLILGEFNDGQFDDTVWQILGRMLGPAYVRPPDQPAGDDPTPPYYLQAHSPRGPYVYRVFEFGIYGWVRGTAAATIQAWRQYFVNCGAKDVC